VRDLEGEAVLVTGATSGIGQEAAVQLAVQGPR
jgi:NAD(P)-dependent dehydrogenase (short-subunit alcohol dehydrogenase family)